MRRPLNSRQTPSILVWHAWPSKQLRLLSLPFLHLQHMVACRFRQPVHDSLSQVIFESFLNKCSPHPDRQTLSIRQTGYGQWFPPLPEVPLRCGLLPAGNGLFVSSVQITPTFLPLCQFFFHQRIDGFHHPYLSRPLPAAGPHGAHNGGISCPVPLAAGLRSVVPESPDQSPLCQRSPAASPR